MAQMIWACYQMPPSVHFDFFSFPKFDVIFTPFWLVLRQFLISNIPPFDDWHFKGINRFLMKCRLFWSPKTQILDSFGSFYSNSKIGGSAHFGTDYQLSQNAGFSWIDPWGPKNYSWVASQISIEIPGLYSDPIKSLFALPLTQITEWSSCDSRERIWHVP